jgi:hypothetical protein
VTEPATEPTEALAVAEEDWTVRGSDRSEHWRVFGQMYATVLYRSGTTLLTVVANELTGDAETGAIVTQRKVERLVDVDQARTWALEMARTWLREQLMALERVR